MSEWIIGVEAENLSELRLGKQGVVGAEIIGRQYTSEDAFGVLIGG